MSDRARLNLRQHIRHIHMNEADTLDWTLMELEDYHMGEHASPGTIRDHDPLDLSDPTPPRPTTEEGRLTALLTSPRLRDALADLLALLPTGDGSEYAYIEARVGSENYRKESHFIRDQRPHGPHGYINRMANEWLPEVAGTADRVRAALAAPPSEQEEPPARIVDDPPEYEPQPSTHVHHWGDDGRCMQPRCGYVRAASTPVPPLDVERLARWFHDKWESQGIACWHKNQHMRSWDCGRDAIEAAEFARPSGDEGADR